MPDYYLQLKIDGSEIKGESGDDAHAEWIEITSISHGISQAAASAASQGGAKPEGRSHHSDIVLTKMYDSSSAKIALACSAGKRVDEAVFELCRATGEKTCFLKITVKNAFISSYSISGGGDIPGESVSIAYTEIEWEYKQLNPDDFKEKTTIGHKWSLKTNTGE
ncbi:Hcp family type VI secretion system effector [Luteolibacter sp. Populi]|uniref:Hcp family type VI secretion system effector n=1 Tax=Luteolibacter sp. Populi TaxID=3230487 RepID=UPI0034669C75